MTAPTGTAHRSGRLATMAPPMPGQSARVAIYYRVSSRLQGEGVSLEVQLQQCRDLIARNGWIEAGIWHDLETGRNDDRASYLAMLAAAASWDVLLVWKVDRLGRDAAELFRVAKEIRRTRRTLVSATEAIDDPFTMGLYFLLAARESWMIGERTRPANQAVVREGRHVGRPTLGYRFVDKRLTPDETTYDDAGAVVHQGTADLYRRLVEMAEANHSYADICRQLNQAGSRTPRGALWQAAAVRTVLLNPVYAGWAYRQGVGLVEGVHQPLIDRDRWTSLQARLDGRSRRRPDAPPDTPAAARRWLLIGHFRCECGAAMSAHKMAASQAGPGREYYACSRRRQAGYCPARSGRIRRDDAEAAVDAWLAPLASLTIDTLAVQAEIRHQAAQSQPGQQTATRRADLERQRQRLTDRLANLVDLLADGTIGRPAYHQAHQSATAEITRLDAELASLPATPAAMDWDRAEARARAQALSALGDYWAAMDTPARRQILDQLRLAATWIGGTLRLQSADPRLEPFLPPLAVTPQRRKPGPAPGQGRGAVTTDRALS